MQAIDSGLPQADESQVGWIAIGGGKAMKGSDDYIVWPNKDGSYAYLSLLAVFEKQSKSKEIYLHILGKPGGLSPIATLKTQ